MRKILLMILILFTLTFSAFAVDISTCDELQNMSLNSVVDYYLVNDINCTGYDYGDGKGFMPIGNGSTGFTWFQGNLYGQNYTIYGLYINRSEREFTGLIGEAYNSDFKDIYFEDAYVNGYNRVGILVGYLGSSGTNEISNVHATGEVLGQLNTNTDVGGLVGYCFKTNFVDCSTDVEVYGAGSQTAGLIGYHNGPGSVTRCYAKGDVTSDSSTGQNYGGLIGYSVITTIDKCYASGDLDIGKGNAGGLVGYASGTTITDSYAKGNVEGTSDGYYYGGLVGYLSTASIMSNCYAIGDVTGHYTIGGLFGRCTGNMVNNTFATGSVNGDDDRIYGIGYLSSGSQANLWWYDNEGDDAVGCGVSGCNEEATLTNFFDKTHNVYDSSSPNWDFNNIWDENSDYYPTLKGLPGQVGYIGGDEDNVTTSGVTNLAIEIDGTPLNETGTITGTQNITFKDEGKTIVVASHDFDSGEINFNLWTLSVAPGFVGINDNSEVVGTKTIYVDKLSSVDSLCVKDAPGITSPDDISDSCNQANEYNFTACIGSSYSNGGGISCTDSGTKFIISGLHHSGAEQQGQYNVPEFGLIGYLLATLGSYFGIKFKRFKS